MTAQGAQSTPPCRVMSVGQALSVLAALRTDEIVVTNQGSAREWPKVSNHPLDFHYIPSNMGGAIPLGLGLALAQPQRNVWIISGDGSLLMNLGCLVTVVAARASNVTVILLDNGVYEITGGQRTASGPSTTWPTLAHGAGFPVTAGFRDVSPWQAQARTLLDHPGPRFVALAVEPVKEDYVLNPPCPIQHQLDRLRRHLSPPPSFGHFVQ